jgi:hypothetical protein
VITNGECPNKTVPSNTDRPASTGTITLVDEKYCCTCCCKIVQLANPPTNIIIDISSDIKDRITFDFDFFLD